jgi:hypothetical protein
MKLSQEWRHWIIFFFVEVEDKEEEKRKKETYARFWVFKTRHVMQFLTQKRLNERLVIFLFLETTTKKNLFSWSQKQLERQKKLYSICKYNCLRTKTRIILLTDKNKGNMNRDIVKRRRFSKILLYFFI